MTAVILAAGFSRRFGREKLLMKLNHKPMIVHVVDVVLSMGFDEILLIYHHEEVKEAVGNRKVKCLYNADAADGQSTSVKCGMRNSGPTDAYIFFTGDQPFITQETVSKLIAAFKEGKGSIIVPRYGGRKGNPVIFASTWKEKLEGITGDVGGRAVIEANPDHVHFVEIADLKAGMDIDTWEEYTLYEGGIQE